MSLTSKALHHREVIHRLALLMKWKVHGCLTSFLIIICRGETGELRVGVRRAMRQLSNASSSVISSHSMHLGVLATAWHAISTGTLFIVYYKPRCVGSAWNNYYIISLSSFCSSATTALEIIEHYIYL